MSLPPEGSLDHTSATVVLEQENTRLRQACAEVLRDLETYQKACSPLPALLLTGLDASAAQLRAALQTTPTPTPTTDQAPRPLPTGWWPCRRCGEPTDYLSIAGAICEACAGGPFERTHASD